MSLHPSWGYIFYTEIITSFYLRLILFVCVCTVPANYTIVILLVLVILYFLSLSEVCVSLCKFVEGL